MPRNISAASLAKLTQKLGTEPNMVLQIRWTEKGKPHFYADKAITVTPENDLTPATQNFLELIHGVSYIVESSNKNRRKNVTTQLLSLHQEARFELDNINVQGKVQSISTLDSVIEISGNSDTQQMSVVLSDTDGEIKNILDHNDIHKRPARVYQSFEGLNFRERFQIFDGEISSPITWNEGDRTVKFDIIKKIEDREVGFSPEEGDFTNIPDEYVGKPWPVVFGTVNDIPGTQITLTKKGTLVDGTGILDFTMAWQVEKLDIIITYATGLGILYAIAAGLFGAQASAESDPDIKAALLQKQKQASQASAQNFQVAGNATTERTALFAEINKQLAQQKTPVRIIGGEQFPQEKPIKLRIGGALFEGKFKDGIFFHIVKRHHPKEGTIFKPQLSNDVFYIVNGVQQLAFRAPTNVSVPQAGFFWAESGATVVIDGDEPIDYVASVTPGTVLRVAARRAFEGIKRLITVDESRYKVINRNYGTINAVIVQLNKPLSSYEGEGWEDNIYITFESTIGPNTVDVLQYLVQTYTTGTPDQASFFLTKLKLANYPSHFAILERKNIITVLKEIAWQARCAIWLTNDIFYLKYLPERPTPIETISESDVENQTLEMSHTRTEDLVTKFIARWRSSYEPDEPNRLILRHNVKKYGTIQQEYDFYIYNHIELVRKSATFWLIRYANTWKKASFRTFLTKLQVETFDSILLDFENPYFADDSVTAFVESADYDSDNKQLVFDCWLPVKAGTMEEYLFAWPADVDEEAIFPTPDEEVAGFGGGTEPGNGATDRFGHGVGDDSDNPNVNINWNDKGDKFPSDVGDQPPTIVNIPNIPSVPNVNPNLVTPPYGNPEAVDPTIDPIAARKIDIRKTTVFDSNTGQSTTFDTFFAEVNGGLRGSTGAIWTDGSQNAPFHFQFSDEVGQFAAGSAFLRDDI